MSSPATVILVEARTSSLSFYRWFGHPRVVIDEEVHHVAWGTHRFLVSPGNHTVEVFFKYLRIGNGGRAEVEVAIAEGETRRLKYSAPLFWQSFLDKGTIEAGDVVSGEPKTEGEVFADVLELTPGRVKSLAQVAPGRVRYNIVFGLKVSVGNRPPKELEHFLEVLAQCLLDQQGIRDTSIGRMAGGRGDIEVTVDAASKQEATENAEVAVSVALHLARNSASSR
jgi:hypothetical protein